MKKLIFYIRGYKSRKTEGRRQKMEDQSNFPGGKLPTTLHEILEVFIYSAIKPQNTSSGRLGQPDIFRFLPSVFRLVRSAQNIFLSFILLCLPINYLSAQDELDLYLIEGAQNNPGLQSKFSSYMAALEQTNVVGHLPDPKVAFAYFIQPVETRLGPQQFKFSVSQMFPWFGTLDAQRSLAAEMAKVKYESFEQAKSHLFYTIKMTYFNLYFINRAISITKENINILEMLQRITIVKYESGKASIVDELRVEMDLNDLNDQLIDLEENAHVLKVKFNKLLNKESESEILVPDSLWTKDLPVTKEQVLDSILQNNHQVKMLENKLKSHEFEETLAEKAGKPTFSVGLDYILIGKSNNAMVDPDLDGRDAIMFPMVSMTVPIYRSKYNAMVEKINLEIKATNLEIEDKRNSLNILFEQGFKDYSDAKRRIELNKNQERLAKQTLEFLMTEYSTNHKNFEEVLRIERKLLSYQLAKDKARSDLNAAVAFIEFLMGR